MVERQLPKLDTGVRFPSPAFSALLIVAIWAVLYVVNVGSSGLRSEEGHRVMPAVQMLDSGNCLVPYMGAKPYLKKPPLVNWIVAASFKLSGVRNEWSARLPSGLFILAVALTWITVARGILGGVGSTVAALCWLTSLGVVEKGRMIEIEAIYMSIFAFAFILWLVWWQERRSPWLTFVLPWIFLGVGLLAKGPSHLIFFYAVICGVLWQTQRLRDLSRPAHLIGVLLMLGIFLAWAIPYFRALHVDSATQTWTHEVIAAFHGEEGRSEEWSLNFPRGLAYFLPWLLLVPFIRFSKIENLLDRQVACGIARGCVVPFVVVLLFPGTLPRYVLPLMAPFCWVIGLASAHDAFEWRLRMKHFSTAVPRQLIFSLIALIVITTMVMFPLRSVTYLKRHERMKPIAAQINAALPPNERLYAIDPDLPYLFYVRAPITYLNSLEQLPADAHYVLIQPGNHKNLEGTERWASMRPKLMVHTSYRGESELFALEGRQ